MIFVAGTGRSGTSQLGEVIGEHPLIRRIPMETHFIVDPGGLRDLADALTVRFDPIVGGDALRRLDHLLSVRMPERVDDRGKTVVQVIGERHYWAAVGRLWSEIVAHTFDERTPWFADRPRGPFAPAATRMAIPRYFRDRSELIAILRRTVDTMFAGSAADAGKPIWAEKTPFNLLCMDFLWELFPEAVIVHIKRDPFAVVASHVHQFWAPPTVEGALAWLKPTYQHWLDWKAATDLTGRRYVEVKAEDLAADWPAQRKALFEQLGVDDFATPSTFDERSLRHRDDQLDRPARDLIERTLGDIIPAMGY
jgi:omega-hydroxy-beta-dihydromenaquinone-9 sulfotransferase